MAGQGSGAVSATAWLRIYARMSTRGAARLAQVGRRLAELPVCAAAAVEGRLSAGQVETIVAVLDDALTPVFASHEAELVPRLVELNMRQLSQAMGAWKARALAGMAEGDEPARSLHHSPTLGGRYETSGSFDAEGGAAIAVALRLATTEDADADPKRSPAQRRGDALVDVAPAGMVGVLGTDARLGVTDPDGRVHTTSPPRAGPMLWRETAHSVAS